MTTDKQQSQIVDILKTMAPYVLLTTCFALWGFANDITTPMVNSFSKIFRMNVTEGVMVHVVYNIGYFVMAFPAAMFIQRYTFKSGVLVGLGLFAVGSLLFFPAASIGAFYAFLLAYFIMTCGLSFLETSCNPFVYSMGSEDSAIQRLNLTQAFNPLGALLGMYVAMNYVQAQMSPMSSEMRAMLPDVQFNIIKHHDLDILIQPYLFVGVIALVLIVLIRIKRMPAVHDERTATTPAQAIAELLRAKNFREGFVAEFFYVGAQVACWTFILQYGKHVFMAEGMEEKAAEMVAQKYNLAAMGLFAVGRFVFTWLMQYVTPDRLLSVLAIVGTAAVCGVILFTDRNGLYCLVLVSGCMSLMFPTIYGIALRGLGNNVKYAGAGLVMAIIGGSVLPPIQAAIIDSDTSIAGLPATNVSFVVPFICFVVIAVYGHRAYLRHVTKTPSPMNSNSKA